MIPRSVDAAAVVLYAALVVGVAGLALAGKMPDKAAIVAVAAALPSSLLAFKRMSGRSDGTLT